MIAIALILIPLLFGVVTMLLKENLSKPISIISSVLSLGLTTIACWMLLQGQTQFLDFQKFLFDEKGLLIFFSLGNVGLSMVLLTNLIFPCVLLFYRTTENKNNHAFLGLLLLIQAGLNGLFMAEDVIMFYLMFELGLVPAYLLIGIWGKGENSAAISFKFFAYTLFGSLLMLVGIIFLIVQTGAGHATDFGNIIRLCGHLPLHQQIWLSGLFLIAFLIKMPMFPFHTWQPGAYNTAPTTVTIVLSALMAKMGVYGLLRFNFQVFPNAFEVYQPYMIALSLIGIIYGAFIALQQDNMKKILAYSSISHMALMVAGIYSMSIIGLKGAVIQMFNHGIIICGLLMMVETIYRKTGSYQLSELGGLAKTTKRLAVVFMVFMMASVALPLTNGFVGEFMLLNAIFTYNKIAAAIAGLTIIFGAVYMLRMYQKSMYGPTNELTKDVTDINVQELLIMIPLILIVLVLGVYPELLNKIIF
jgi:NADH-quinone oxidoreductase subunit M